MTTPTRSPVWLTAADCRLPDFRAVCEQKTELADYPHATDPARVMGVVAHVIQAG